MEFARRFAVALAASFGVLGAIDLAPASAAVDCHRAGTTLTVTMSADGDAALIQRSGGDILVREAAQRLRARAARRP
jgi:hypothetical protein